MMTNPQHRCVFVGNIPYDATEEQVVQICEEDEETALSARRNLHGYDINGRQLKVDFAENDKNNDKSREQGRGGPGLPSNIASQNQIGSGAPALHGDPSLHQAFGVQLAMAAAIMMARTLGGGQTNSITSQNGINSQPILGTDPLTLHLVKMPKGQLIEVLTELKTMATQNKEQARQLLFSHPQVKGGFAVPPHLLQMPNARQLPGLQAPPVQGGQPLPGLLPLGQNTVQLGSLVPSQYAAPSLPRFPTPPPAPNLDLQHSTLSGLPLAGNLQSLLPRQTASLSNRVENQMAASSSMLQYPGQNASTNLGHNPQLFAPIQPSIPTHKLAPCVDSALLQQVLNLTPEQLKTLPPEQQQQVIQLQQMLRQST